DDDDQVGLRAGQRLGEPVDPPVAAIVLVGPDALVKLPVQALPLSHLQQLVVLVHAAPEAELLVLAIPLGVQAPELRRGAQLRAVRGGDSDHDPCHWLNLPREWRGVPASRPARLSPPAPPFRRNEGEARLAPTCWPCSCRRQAACS